MTLSDSTLSRTGDYDEIGLRGQTFSSKPVFFAAMKIKNEDIQTVMDQIFNNSAQQTTIGVKAYSAVCQPTTEEVDGGKNLKYHNQYLVELTNGDALLFEVQWFEENKNFRETEATGESEDTAETESVRETEETVKDTGTAAESSKEVVAESASKKLSEMLDSISSVWRIRQIIIRMRTSYTLVHINILLEITCCVNTFISSGYTSNA